MSGKMPKDVENQMIAALQGLKNLRREQEDKQYKKHWGEIQIPFTLTEGLRRYTKTELDTIRKSLEISNASNLKKLDLIELLTERLQTDFCHLSYK